MKVDRLLNGFFPLIGYFRLFRQFYWIRFVSSICYHFKVWLFVVCEVILNMQTIWESFVSPHPITCCLLWKTSELRNFPVSKNTYVGPGCKERKYIYGLTSFWKCSETLVWLQLKRKCLKSIKFNLQLIGLINYNYACNLLTPRQAVIKI